MGSSPGPVADAATSTVAGVAAGPGPWSTASR